MATEPQRILCNDGDAGLDRFGERDVVETDQGDLMLAAGVHIINNKLFNSYFNLHYFVLVNLCLYYCNMFAF